MTQLTPNRRLAATLLKHYNQTHIQKGHSCWPSCDILPFQSWLQRVWLEYSLTHAASPLPYLLSAQQETALWEELLRQSPKSHALLHTSATAELAKSAWGLLKQWRIDLTHPLLKMTEDSRVFLEWANQFQQLCHERHWLDTASLIDVIIELMEQQKIKPPAEIILKGFTELSLQQKYLFSICEKHGAKIIINSHPSENDGGKTPAIYRLALTDEETEILTMARFAKSLFDTHSSDPGASLSIGCVVPDLERIRDRVAKIFSDVFQDNAAFNISAGKSLALYPVIHTALELLKLSQARVPIETLSYLLRSPFLGEAEQEHVKRAQLDKQLRSQNVTHIPLTKLSGCPALIKRINTLLSENHAQALLPISQWITIFMNWLTLLGWPGERSLNSPEYQVVQRWLDGLNELQSWDTIFMPQTLQAAIHILTRFTTNISFQPQSPEAPVQVLGLLEAAGLPFNYIWVMGMDDTAWPPAAKPNPFIPQQLQKTLHMPHATAERELEYSRLLTQQLIQGTEHIVFSHAEKNNEGALRPSSLILPCKELTLEELKLNQFISPAQLIFHHRRIEILYDDEASIIFPHEKIQGGVNIFKQQAACPFKAFAEMRLHAKPIDPITIDLRESERGTIVHKALEFIWGELKDSLALQQIEKQMLKNLIHVSAKRAIEELTKKSISDLRYLQLELQRLETILWNWLIIEKERPAFKVISQEEQREVSIGNIAVILRVDRVDELSEGGHCIIDYKTGRDHTVQRWLGERPDEPQLPLYCITHPEETAAISFAHVRSAKPGFKSLGKDTLKDKTWSQQLTEWRQILEKIGSDFYHGKAQIAPKHKEETCHHCHLQALCRIYE